jgi:hypothetical protein
MKEQPPVIDTRGPFCGCGTVMDCNPFCSQCGKAAEGTCICAYAEGRHWTKDCVVARGGDAEAHRLEVIERCKLELAKNQYENERRFREGLRNDGAQAERARIVEWLRSHHYPDDKCPSCGGREGENYDLRCTAEVPRKHALARQFADSSRGVSM